jgi:hypothetical protein
MRIVIGLLTFVVVAIAVPAGATSEFGHFLALEKQILCEVEMRGMDRRYEVFGCYYFDFIPFFSFLSLVKGSLWLLEVDLACDRLVFTSNNLVLATSVIIVDR